jgi:hypothetical protein
MGEELTFNGQKGIRILGVPKVMGDSIIATVLFWGAKPGTYAVQIGQCEPKTIEILRGF